MSCGKEKTLLQHHGGQYLLYPQNEMQLWHKPAIFSEANGMSDRSIFPTIMRESAIGVRYTMCGKSVSGVFWCQKEISGRKIGS